MSLERLVAKYITSAEKVLREIKITNMSINVGPDEVGEVMNSVKSYLQDAKYYRSEHKFEVSLTSIAYCEGLLDGLRMLGAVSFEWPMGRKEREE